MMVHTCQHILNDGAKRRFLLGIHEPSSLRLGETEFSVCEFRVPDFQTLVDVRINPDYRQIPAIMSRLIMQDCNPKWKIITRLTDNDLCIKLHLAFWSTVVNVYTLRCLSICIYTRMCFYERYSHQVYERWVEAITSIFWVIAFKLMRVDMEMRTPTHFS